MQQNKLNGNVMDANDYIIKEDISQINNWNFICYGTKKEHIKLAEGRI